jgi:hypothetical protein
MSIGAGAIFQVVYSIGSWMLRSHNQHDEVKEKKSHFSEYFYHSRICGWNDNNVCNRITCITI